MKHWSFYLCFKILLNQSRNLFIWSFLAFNYLKLNKKSIGWDWLLEFKIIGSRLYISWNMLTNACKTPITIFQSISNEKKSMVRLRSIYIHRSFLEALRLFKKSYFQDLMQKQVYFRPSFDEKVIISGRSVLLSPFNFLENLMAPFYG